MGSLPHTHLPVAGASHVRKREAAVSRHLSAALSNEGGALNRRKTTRARKRQKKRIYARAPILSFLKRAHRAKEF